MDRKDLSLFLVGLSMGVGIAMLFAPKSGQETRALITGKASEGTEYLKQRGAEAKQTTAEWIKKGKEALGGQKESPNDAGQVGDAITRTAAAN